MKCFLVLLQRDFFVTSACLLADMLITDQFTAALHCADGIPDWSTVVQDSYRTGASSSERVCAGWFYAAFVCCGPTAQHCSSCTERTAVV